MLDYYIKEKLENKKVLFLFTEDQDLISADNTNWINLQGSYFSDVYTNYSSVIINRSVAQEDAIGLNNDLKEKGFIILCVDYPRKNLNDNRKAVKNNIHNDQFGKYQK